MPEVVADSSPANGGTEAVARQIVSFLQGIKTLENAWLADSVTLLVAPEGGGGRTMLRREELADPASWVVASGDRSFALAPPAGHTKLTTKQGKHLNCQEHDLVTRYAELARYPHVGVMLQPEVGATCMQSWNLTLVFDSPSNPRLIAAVYDQWEW